MRKAGGWDFPSTHWIKRKVPWHMKESKAPGNLFAILEKYQSGIEQILLRLPLFLFDNEVNIDSVNFRAITFYNQEFINEALKRLPFYQSDDQVRLFTS